MTENMATRRVTVRFTEKEMESVYSKMEQMGIINMSAFVRKMVMEGIIVRLQVDELKEIIRLMRYAGNNLNQLARKANGGGPIYEEEIRDIRGRFEKMTEDLNRLVRELGKIC